MTWIRAAVSLVAVLTTLAAPGTALARIDVSYAQSSGVVVTATTQAFLTIRTREVGGVQGLNVHQIAPSGVVDENTITAGTGCNEPTLFEVFCEPTGTRAVAITLSDAASEGVRVNEVQLGDPEFIATMTIDGRGGRDDVQGSRRGDSLLGGDGDDILQPDRGNDSADGGAGDDTLFASNFLTLVHAENIGPNGADVYKGGPGTDIVLYAERKEPVVVTLDGQANDGAAGENDNVGPDNDIEKVTGGERDDTLVGNSGANVLSGNLGADTVRGEGGNDVVSDGDSGGTSNDKLDGGPGADILKASHGNDTLDSRDGTRDVEIDCGEGLEDRAVVDLFDTSKFVKNCELVSSFAIDDAPPGMPLGGRLRIRPNGVASVAIACPRRARVRCRGRMSLRDPKRRSRVLATGSYTVRLGRKARVALLLTQKEPALLRRRGRALVTTRERGISRRGPRSAERLLRLARS